MTDIKKKICKRKNVQILLGKQKNANRSGRRNLLRIFFFNFVNKDNFVM